MFEKGVEESADGNCTVKNKI
jgi:hypothetical protein